MAWAVVQSVGAFTNAAGTTRALAYGSNVTAGNRGVAWCMWNLTTATCALTDSQGNTWAGVAASLATNGTNARCQVFHGPLGSSAADTVTMTTSASCGERVILIGEVSGLSGSIGASPLAASGTSANPSSNITIDAVTSLMFGGCYTGGTASQGSGFTLFGTVQDGNPAEYRTPAGTGAQPMAFTEAASNVWAISAVEFLISGGGGGVTVKQLAALGAG